MLDLNYDWGLKFDKYKNDTNYDNLSFASKFDFASKDIHDKLENLTKSNVFKKTVAQRKLVFNKASDIWKLLADNKLHTIFWTKKIQRGIPNTILVIYFLMDTPMNYWYDKPNDKELDDKVPEGDKKEEFPDSPLMPTLEANKEEAKEEVKEWTGIKFLNNQYKLKNEIRQKLYLFH